MAAPTARSPRLSSPTRRNDLTPELELADRLDMDSGRVRGQVGERYLLDIDDLDRLRARPGGHRLLGRLLLGTLERLLTGDLVEREDAVDLTADLCDRGPDRIGYREMRRLHDLRRTGKGVTEQDRAAA